ncbi:hypothetical protein HHK36_010251 [Tetracentron sinense]|uniref:ATP synthase subunit e, mitochondrial n=1 Tax=Tetracentron sinense TaxID=13715 RepID=A0A835DM72_TETSI|nr:hypothetical protein HHK36_010251 [Tetracentron sinense]
MAPPPGPYSGTSTLALVARASAFTFGLVYGSMKLKYLKDVLLSGRCDFLRLIKAVEFTPELELNKGNKEAKGAQPEKTEEQKGRSSVRRNSGRVTGCKNSDEEDEVPGLRADASTMSAVPPGRAKEVSVFRLLAWLKLL